MAVDLVPSIEKIIVRRKRTYGDAVYSATDMKSFFQFDATLNEKHSEEAQITQHPVETGMSISDNVLQKPAKLEIQGIVSNTPLDNTNERSRDISYWNDLVEIKNKGELVVVATAARVYDNMLITNIAGIRSAGKGQSIDIAISLEQVKIVNEKSVMGLYTTKKIKPGSKSAVSKTEDKGNSAGKDKVDAKTKTSLLLQLKNLLIGN